VWRRRVPTWKTFSPAAAQRSTNSWCAQPSNVRSARTNVPESSLACFRRFFAASREPLNRSAWITNTIGTLRTPHIGRSARQRGSLLSGRSPAQLLPRPPFHATRRRSQPGIHAVVRRSHQIRIDI
jgi:hypothetical protein